MNMAKNKGIHQIRKKITTQFELISTSYHESSHTIYALLHYMKVGSVCIFQDPKLKRIHGFTYYEYITPVETVEDPELRNLLVRAELGISYSGLIGEKTLFKSISGSNQTPAFISDGSTEDNKSARELIKKYDLAPPGAKRSLYKKKLSRQIQHELYEHWDALTLVAHVLFKRRKLTFEDLQELLTKKAKNKDFWKEQFKIINYLCNNSELLDESDLKEILYEH